MRIITARPHRLLEICIKRIGELVSAGENCMLLVPSQYTLQAEIEVMTRLGIQGSFLIDVLSPNRFKTRVFERAGEPGRIIFDERGKHMVLHAILEEEKDSLTAYRTAMLSGGAGLTQKISAMIASLKQSEITAAELNVRVSQMEEDNPLTQKLRDIVLIYAAYEEKMRGRLADGEDVAREVREKMERSGILNGQHVFVYGFDMITPTFALDLLHMCTQADSLTVAIETDRNSAADGRLFAPVNASIDRLCALAKERDVAIEREVVDCEIDSQREIRLLERGLFALGGAVYAGEPQKIELRTASSPRMEVHLAAAKIRQMIEQGTDPADISIVFPRGSGYMALLESILPMYDLPVYVAQKRPAGMHPLCRFLLSALAVVSGGWKTSDVIECIQSGFLRLERTQADALCAYAEGADLRRDDWKHPFTYIKDGKAEELDALNESRRSATEPLIAFSENLLRAKTADDTVHAVVTLLEDVSAMDTLEWMRQELSSAGFAAQADDCAQVSVRVMETLDQLHTLLGGESVCAQVVSELLASGLSAMELAALPPVDGAIICGEIGNIRTAQVGSIFAIGMNDAADGGQNGILTQQETEAAARAIGAYLGMSASEKAALAQLDILKTLSGAKERLYISYALADETGRALREGEAVRALKRLFPDISARGGLASAELEQMLCAPKPALQALSVMLCDAADDKSEPSGRMAQTYAILCASQEERENLTAVTRRLGEPIRSRLDASQARTLYGRPVMSVSRLEAFAQCPYRHFVRYGLSPQEEMRSGVDRAQLGTLYHEAAERFTQSITGIESFPDVPGEICDRLMDDAVAPLIKEWRKSPLGKSARGAAIAGKIARIARRTGRNIVSQFASSEFRPVRSEFVFGQRGIAPITLELSDGTRIYLQGRIDRVDIMEDNGRIRVIDYKSGSKKFDPTMVYWGLQLQLLIYLAAALSQIPGSTAAGFFYCRIADPIIKSESRVKEEIEKQIAKKLSLAGISISDVSILRAQGAAHSAMITREGKPSGRYAGALVEEAQMDRLVAFAQNKAGELAEAAYAGVIDDLPAERGQYVACAACDYAAICGFDPSRKKRRRLSEKKLEDLV